MDGGAGQGSRVLRKADRSLQIQPLGGPRKGRNAPALSPLRPMNVFCEQKVLLRRVHILQSLQWLARGIVAHSTRAQETPPEIRKAQKAMTMW